MVYVKLVVPGRATPGGFWLFKEYFNLSISQTIRTWSLMETIVSIVGLLGVLALNLVV